MYLTFVSLLAGILYSAHERTFGDLTGLAVFILLFLMVITIYDMAGRDIASRGAR